MNRIKLKPILFLTSACLVSFLSVGAHAQRLTIKELSSGACMVACNDVSFCMSFDYNDQSGACTLFLNPEKTQFIRLKKSCPQSPVGSWVVSMWNEKWTINCPDSNLQQAPPPSADMMNGLQ